MPNTFKGFYQRGDEVKVDVWSSEEPSQTLQEFKDESDINNLVARFKQTGAFYDALAARNLGAQPRVPIFEDVSEIPDFAAAQDIINQGKATFEAIPPSIRRKFDNSLELFLGWLTANRNNPAALREVGFIGPQVPDQASGDGLPTPTPDITMSGGVQGTSSPASVKPAPQQGAGASANASGK